MRVCARLLLRPTHDRIRDRRLSGSARSEPATVADSWIARLAHSSSFYGHSAGGASRVDNLDLSQARVPTGTFTVRRACVRSQPNDPGWCGCPFQAGAAGPLAAVRPALACSY